MDIKKLVDEMTLKEKVGQLNQRLYGWQCYEKTADGIILTDYFKDEVRRWDSLGVIYGVFRSDPWSGRNKETGLNKEEAFLVAKMIQSYLKENTRLGIPAFLAEECPHGHQAIDSTTIPTNISTGASWNPDLYAQVQEVVAEELREKGAHLSLISTLDVVRDPRWGRTEECFSEDPYLTSRFSIAALDGLQGNQSEAISSNKSLAVLKHFAAQGSTMGGHNAGPVSLGDQELRDIHLYPMQESIKNGAKLTMAAYNDLDGVPCHGNPELLKDILRDEFKFDGAVMADGCALDRLVPLVGSREAAAAWALESGVDISLWDNVFPYVEQAVESGLVEEKYLDQAVIRILKLKEQMGLFEEATPKISSRSREEKERLNLAMATESVVLLKNKNKILPFDSNIQKVAVIGPNADNLYNQLGDYTPFKNEEAGVTLLNGLKRAFKGDVIYEQGSKIMEEIPNGIEKAVEAAKLADIIVVALGGSSTRDFGTLFDDNGAALSGSNEMTCGENIDLANISLPKPQQKLVRELKKLEKPIVAVLIQGRPHSLTEIDDLVDGIMIAGYPGELGGLALANLMVGEDSPSGKLAISIPRSSMQLPVYYNYRAAAFKEDYFDDNGKALYPFGAGLSYSDFEIQNVKVTVAGDMTISGKIKNEGELQAAEVIQVYLCRGHLKVIPRVKELRGFSKVWLLPGEEREFKIVIPKEEFKSFDYVSTIIEATGFQEKFEVKKV